MFIELTLNSAYELTCVLDSDKFSKLFDRVYNTLEHVDENKYADYTLASKGITVLYRDSQYKKVGEAKGYTRIYR